MTYEELCKKIYDTLPGCIIDIQDGEIVVLTGLEVNDDDEVVNKYP